MDTEDYEKRQAEVTKKNRRKRKSQTNSTKSEQSKDSLIHNPKVKSKQFSSTKDYLSDSVSGEQQRKRKKKRSTFKEFEEELKSFKEAKLRDAVGCMEKVEEKVPKGPEVVIFEDPAKRKKVRYIFTD